MLICEEKGDVGAIMLQDFTTWVVVGEVLLAMPQYGWKSNSGGEANPKN